MKANTKYVPMSFFVCILCLLVAGPSWSATYYVNVNSGTDDPAFGSGPDAGAWKSIEYAVAQLADNDVLNVAPGTYMATDVYPAPDGNAATVSQDGVAILGAPGVIISGAMYSLWSSGFNITGSNVTLKNLTITQFKNDGTPAVDVFGSNNLLESCVISSNDYGVVYNSGSGGGNIIKGCTIYDNQHGIDAENSSPQIYGNRIYDNSFGIRIVETLNTTITPQVYNNLIYSSGAGTAMDYGIYIYAFSAGSKASASIFHNTIYGATLDGIYISHEEQLDGLIIKFNIISKCDDYGIQNTNVSSDPEMMYNDTFSNTSGDYSKGAMPPGNVSVDPLFVDAVGLDFYLEATSPLLNIIRSDAGDTVSDDLSGLTRPNGLGHEMGCFEIDHTTALWVHNVASDIGYSRLVMPDIDGDGYDELLLFEDYEQVRIISGADGITELWSYVLSTDPGRYRRGLTLVNDLDGDAISDIIAVVGTSGNGYGENNGDDEVYAISGAVSPPGGRVLFGGSPLNLGYGASSPVILSDIDGDAYEDVFLNTITPETLPVLRADFGYLISGKDGSVLWNYTYNPSTPASSESGIWDVYGKTAAPDLDGDGKDDIVVSGAGGLGGIEAWKGGTTAANIWRGLTGVDLRSPAVVGDANLDGVPDIAAGKFHTGTCPASPDPRMYVLNGRTGSVLWQYPLDRTPSSIESLGDVNGDSIEDVVIGTALINGCGGGDSSVYAFDGFTGADDRVLWSYSLTDQNSSVKVVVDADGDGIKDVAVTGQEDRLVLLSGADGSVLAQESFPNGSGIVQPGEFNNTDANDMLTSMGNSVYALSFIGMLGNAPPAKPTLLSPADEAVYADSTAIMLMSSAFSDPEGGAQTGLTWTLVRVDSEEPAGSFPVTFDQGPFPTEYQIADLLSEGLKYTWQVGHKDDQGREVWSEERSFKIGTSIPESLPVIASGTALVDFGMISVVHWPDSPLPGKVFNIKYDPNAYRIGTYDPVLGRYVEFGPDLVIEPGRAYWMLARDGLTVNFDGVPVSKETNIEVCLHHNGNANAPNGWNMIAPPNASNYLWNEVLVGRWLGDNHPDNVAPVPVTYPAASDLINHRIYEWQNGGYADHKLDENFVLEYYKGYWVKALVEGAYLEFPVSAQVNGLSTPKNTILAWKGRAVQWIQRLLPSPREAIADDDLPPMPLDTFEGGANPVFEGCFVQTILK